MSDLICSKTMMRCPSPGMCVPFGGCQPSILKEVHVTYSNRSQPCVAAVERDGANERAGMLLKAKNYFADRARLAEAARTAMLSEVERLKDENADLAAHLADAEHRAENAGRNASAFEDRMGDLQVENGKLRAEVERLRHALERINARTEAYTEDGRGMTECSTLVVAEIAHEALQGFR